MLNITLGKRQIKTIKRFLVFDNETIPVNTSTSIVLKFMISYS